MSAADLEDFSSRVVYDYAFCQLYLNGNKNSIILMINNNVSPLYWKCYSIDLQQKSSIDKLTG